MSRQLIVAAAAAVVVVTGGVLAAGGASTLVTDPGPGDRDERFQFRIVDQDGLSRARPALRDPAAPLSTAERGYAIGLARAALPGSARNVLGAAGAEVLAAEVPPVSGRDRRRLVQVMAYDYHDDRLHQLVIDLAAGAATEQRAVRGVQPPPSAAETQVALNLALAAHPALPFVLQFQELTGGSLLTGEQVHTVAGAWLPETPDGAAARTAADGCGSQRCLRLLVALPSGLFLDTSDFVVNLSDRTVVSVPERGRHEH